MAKTTAKSIRTFYGGMTRDDKSKINGVASNIEELDILSNADYIQAEQIFSTDTLPSTSELYSYTSSADGTAYGYGKETAASKVRLFSVASGGAANPGAWGTLFTSSDSTNLATSKSPLQYFKTTETNSESLYFVKGASASWYIGRYNLTAAQEERWTGSAWSASGSADSNSQLTGLTGSFDRITIKVIYGEVFITHGKFIAKIDKDGVVTLKAFTLPNEWKAIDLVPVSDVALILAQYIDRTVNFSKGFWWDLTNTVQFDDSFELPCGGPQWIVNHKETIKMFCAINGVGRFFQLSGAYPGAIPVELPGLVIQNVGTETTSQVVSSSKNLGVKDKILYFGLFKTDKTGLYAIGQLDSDKPTALFLSKRYATSDYSLHKPTGLMIQGSNFYGAYSDNGTASTVRCETLNSPDRSSSGVYESIVIDLGDATTNKDLTNVYITTQPLSASTDVNVSVASDYGSYTEYFRGNGTSMNTTSAVLGAFSITDVKGKKSFKIKTQLVSSGTSSPKLTSIGFEVVSQSVPASE